MERIKEQYQKDKALWMLEKKKQTTKLKERLLQDGQKIQNGELVKASEEDIKKLQEEVKKEKAKHEILERYYTKGEMDGYKRCMNLVLEVKIEQIKRELSQDMQVDWNDYALTYTGDEYFLEIERIINKE